MSDGAEAQAIEAQAAAAGCVADGHDGLQQPSRAPKSNIDVRILLWYIVYGIYYMV